MTEPDPVAVWSGEIRLSGVTLRAYVLDDGTRVIDMDDAHALFEAWEGGAALSEGEAAEFARWLLEDWNG